MLARARYSVAALAVAILSIFALSSMARAQVNYTEPPDLDGNANTPTPVGTVAVGFNSIHGTISGVAVGPAGSGDLGDNASFIVPAGLVVTQVVLIVSNYSNPSPSTVFTRANSASPGLTQWYFTGNGIGPNLVTPAGGVLAAGTYNIGVGAFADFGQSGSVSFTWEFHIAASVASNDTCQLAIPIGLGPTAFNNTSATTDGPPHSACNFFGNLSVAKDLWYTHTPALSGILTVSTCGSLFDTEVNVYNGGTAICNGSDATLLACNDDNPAACGASSTQSQVAVPVAAGQTYLIRVGGYDGTNASGAGTLTLSAVTTGACCNRWTGHCTVRGQSDCTSQGLRFDGFGAACSPASCKACPAEFNGNGTLEVADIFAFLNSWFGGCP